MSRAAALLPSLSLRVVTASGPLFTALSPLKAQGDNLWMAIHSISVSYKQSQQDSRMRTSWRNVKSNITLKTISSPWAPCKLLRSLRNFCAWRSYHCYCATPCKREECNINHGADRWPTVLGDVLYCADSLMAPDSEKWKWWLNPC